MQRLGGLVLFAWRSVASRISTEGKEAGDVLKADGKLNRVGVWATSMMIEQGERDSVRRSDDCRIRYGGLRIEECICFLS
jgi:hypothetical protein